VGTDFCGYSHSENVVMGQIEEDALRDLCTFLKCGCPYERAVPRAVSPCPSRQTRP